MSKNSGQDGTMNLHSWCLFLKIPLKSDFSLNFKNWKSHLYPTQAKYHQTTEKYWNREQGANAGITVLFNSRSRNRHRKREGCQGLSSEFGSQTRLTAWLGAGRVTPNLWRGENWKNTYRAVDCIQPCMSICGTGRNRASHTSDVCKLQSTRYNTLMPQWDRNPSPVT